MWSPQGQSRPIGTSYRHKALSSFASETDRWDSTVLPTLRSGKRKANAPGSYGMGNTTAAKSDAPAPVSRFNYLRERTMARFRGRVDSKFHESVVPNSVLRGNGDRQGDDDDEEDEEQRFFVHEDVHVPFRLQLRHILTSSSVGVAIDLISCTLSVIACVFYVWSTYDKSLETLFLFIEAGISAFFLLEYMLRFYVTSHRVRFFFSWFSIVDILTIVPVVFDLLLHESITGTSLAFRIIQILRVLRIARLLRIHRVFTYLKTELQRETARFILNMISITFITAAFIFAIENSLREELYVEPLLFHDAYYFTIVTVSTVGFGDIKVYTQLSRAFIVLIHADGALKFLQEFFHPDHGTQGDVHVVFLMGNLPSAELKMVLESQRYEMSVTYLQGSVHSIEDLDRARAWDVAAVFDIVICTNQLKMELMAKHCLCPGITTFITNLVISLDDDAQRDRGVDSLAPWEKEYRAGCDFELYRTKLTQGFSGIYFEDIALALYMETGTLVIGVEVSAAMHMTDGSTHAKSRLLLNPVGFVIPDTTEFSVHAIVIAQDRASANLSTWRSNPQEPGKGGGGLTASFYGLTAPAQKMSSMKFNTQNTDKPETEASRIEAKVRMYNPTEARPGIEISRKMAEFDSTSLQHQVSSGSGDKRAYGAASERLQRAKIHSQLCEEHPNVKNHVVFIGSTTDLAAFVRILRHKTKGATKNLPVVVLSTTMPSVQTWAALPGEGEHVYIVEGSPLDTFDLKRAGVHYASCAVVSTTQGQMKQAGRALSVDSQRDDSEALAVADADAIFAHQGILRLNPDIEIITEVVNTENIVFLETKSRLLHKAERHLSFHVAPKETADGAQKRPSQVRRMAPTLPDAGDEEFDGTVDIGKNDRHTRGLIASGTIFTISLLDALLAQSFYNPKVLAVLEQLLAGESQTDADAAMWAEVLGEASSSLMYVASVPEEFEEATYGDVFRYFCLEKGMLSVGISRGVTLRRAGISTLGNRHRYVLTNPPAETVLQRQDKIFVLALMEPEEETRGGGMLDKPADPKPTRILNYTKANSEQQREKVTIYFPRFVLATERNFFTAATMVSPTACVTLRITAKSAQNLKNLQTLLPQDPYVRVETLPWNDEAETKAAHGTDPVWKPKHRPVMELPYYGRPVPPDQALLLVEVLDWEATRKNRIIGGNTLDLAQILRKTPLGETRELVVPLKDPDGKSAGTVFLEFEVVMRGTFEVTVLSGRQLRNIQSSFEDLIKEQDPYARVSFLPAPENGNKQVASTKAARGVNPVWDRKRHKSKLTFDFDGEDKPRLLVEVLDEEVLRKDRLIGTGALDLIKRVLSEGAGAREVHKTVTVELVDEEFVPAGSVELDIHFINEAYDESKPVITGLSSRDLNVDIHKMSGSDLLRELGRLFIQVEGELESAAPGFLHEVTDRVPISALFLAMWGLLGALGVVILLTRGAKLLSLCVGVLFPCYWSFKAIETEGKDDDTQWLMYWMIFGTSMVLEETLFKVPAMLQPGLFFATKMIFLVWLSHPKFQGATVAYRRLVAPILRRYEDRIDERLRAARKAVKDLDDRVRLEPESEDES
ncbi:Receptor expression-enhancing protein 1 [Hondaea fermentalgiana]|uniref:Receptor expression-enhancing protein 1 n=1 Tax=Hondaea fermentalgiana TaxID=2315210 RepID=A0A2R5G837_9STRA|nr:Receptor expression-enhancing protein 1 [Hondaea fermentalgiana]|eukprot:GBG25958.1 Receptor expression-enhancing protein 1 [Hondaea fermentalgiana]